MKQECPHHKMELDLAKATHRSALVYGVLVLIVVSFLVYFYNGTNQYSGSSSTVVAEETGICPFNYKLGQRECRPICEDDNMFRMPGMAECLAWLECEEITQQLEFVETVRKHKFATVSPHTPRTSINDNYVQLCPLNFSPLERNLGHVSCVFSLEL